jgi:hypothetical protein
VKWRLILVGVAIAALLVPLPSALVERAYSSSIFPALQRVATRTSNLAPVALFDVFVLVALAALAWLCARDVRRKRLGRALVSMAVRLVTLASAIYLVFLLCWGLNYQREPLREKVPFDGQRITADAVLELARDTVGRLNATHTAAHAAGFPAQGELSASLARSFGKSTVSLALANGVVPARPKRSIADLYFRRAGVAGMTDPFFLETLVATDLLPFERPMVVAHEWAHLAGVTDEGEANFVGWLTCVRGTVAEQYSGWLFLYSEVMNALSRDVAREVSASLGPGPRADLQAVRERDRREVSRRLSVAGWLVYDRYLKTNRVEAGVASYGEVLRLVLGTGLR